MGRLLLILALLFPVAAGAWPTNVVKVTDTKRNSDCGVGTGVPYGGCNVNGTATDILDGLDGADIADALNTCKAAHGCILYLPCGDYRNVAIDIHEQSSYKAGGRNGGSFNSNGSDFSNGLIIEGDGDCSNLYSEYLTVGPSAASNGSGQTENAMFVVSPYVVRNGIWFRNLQMNGKAEYLKAPGTSGSYWAAPNPSVASTSNVNHALYHAGIMVWNPTTSFTSGPFKVTNSYIHSFLGGGVLIRGFGPIDIFNNRVDHIGCQQDFKVATCDADAGGLGLGPNADCISAGNTWVGADANCTGAGTSHATPYTTCTGAGTGTKPWTSRTSAGEDVDSPLECGCLSGAADCGGWDTLYQRNLPSFGGSGASPGFQVEGYAIQVSTQDTNRVNIVGNVVSNVQKYAINLFTGTFSDFTTAVGGTLGGSAQPPEVVRNNTVSESVLGLVCGSGCPNSIWDSNTVLGNTTLQGQVSTDSAGMAILAGSNLVDARNNTFTGMIGPGIMVRSYLTNPFYSRAHVYTNNTVSSIGQWCAAGSTCAGTDLAAGMFRYTGFSSSCNGFGSAIPYQQTLPMVLTNNTFSSGSGTWYGLNLGHSEFSQVCPASRIDPLVMSGNVMAAGSWAAHNTLIGAVRAQNINATTATLTDTGTSGTFTFEAASTGSCATFSKLGMNTVVDSSGGGVTGAGSGCP